jgi:hypothetical protein
MNTQTKQNQKKLANLSSEEIDVLDTMIFADSLYEAILGQLQIDQNDEIYKNLVLGALKRQTRDRLIFSIWKHLDENQRVHLRDFIAETTITAPWVNLDDALITFANLYPSLMTKVYADLTDFFKKFIENFNKILKTSF